MKIEMKSICCVCAEKGMIKRATEIHFGRGYCEEHSIGWHPEMKPNPCKDCGGNAWTHLTERHVQYFCGSLSCPGHQEACVDFDTWQKNNPLSEKKAARRKAAEDMVEEYQANPELNFDLPPHQFKVGDKFRIKETGDIHKVKRDEMFGVAYGKNSWIGSDLITPATRLKRKEIRERLKKLKDPARFGYSIQDEIDQLIEEI